MLLLAAWKAAAHLDLLDRLLLPSPRRIGAAALELLAGVVGPGAETTVTAALGGPAPGIAIGIVIGVIAAARCGHASAHTATRCRCWCSAWSRPRPARPETKLARACRPRQQNLPGFAPALAKQSLLTPESPE